ncbi:hypothetical protein [Priestia megaterium]
MRALAIGTPVPAFVTRPETVAGFGESAALTISVSLDDQLTVLV